METNCCSRMDLLLPRKEHETEMLFTGTVNIKGKWPSILNDFAQLEWLIWFSIVLCTKGLSVRFLVKAHAWVAGLILHIQEATINVPLSLSPSLTHSFLSLAMSLGEDKYRENNFFLKCYFGLCITWNVYLTALKGFLLADLFHARQTK